MQPNSRKLLEDIRQAAVLIEEFVRDRTYQEYAGDALLQSGVERRFEIIGEALKRLARDDPEVVARISQYSRIIAFRNILIHAYDVVDHAVVWDAAQSKLPILQREVVALLSECEGKT